MDSDRLSRKTDGPHHPAVCRRPAVLLLESCQAVDRGDLRIPDSKEGPLFLHAGIGTHHGLVLRGVRDPRSVGGR